VCSYYGLHVCSQTNKLKNKLNNSIYPLKKILIKNIFFKYYHEIKKRNLLTEFNFFKLNII